ncbi:MAG: chorismate synthase [Candidatus Kaelpia aquatica]|nr:chorismate synthase [Candidatus Kaelpia aquatica]
MLRFLTAGESHGKALSVIVDGFPAGVKIDRARIDSELSRRQVGYGRGGRMKIEKDRVEIISGISKGLTFGAPIAILIKNKDFSIDRMPAIGSPRPGHADLAGGMKYGLKDFRLILERASARETAARVAVGALAKQFLDSFNISIFSHVIQIGDVRVTKITNTNSIQRLAERSKLRCVDAKAELEMVKLIDKARAEQDSLGGVFEVIASNVPAGLGSYVQWDLRLDSEIGSSVLSIPAVKAVEVGDGVKNTSLFGSEVQDEIGFSKSKGFKRATNRAGGLEGGITNGEPLVVRGYMKPIATLSKPLRSVNVRTKKEAQAFKERADICAVPAAGVVAESMISFIVMKSFLDKFSSDNLFDIISNFKSYQKRLKDF